MIIACQDGSKRKEEYQWKKERTRQDISTSVLR